MLNLKNLQILLPRYSKFRIGWRIRAFDTEYTGFQLPKRRKERREKESKARKLHKATNCYTQRFFFRIVEC